VGRPRWLPPEGPAWIDKRWHSAIVKERVDEPRWLGRLNLEGDAQADLRVHGGPDRALLTYSADHYPRWRAELGRPDLPHGAFGENLTVAGLGEDDVCIGDVYRLGRASVQVSEPRGPCWKLAWRWQVEGLDDRVRASGRTGWYLRVLEEAEIRPQLEVELVERPNPGWTVRRAAAAMEARRRDPGAAAELAACSGLSASWRERLQRALELQAQSRFRPG
jgi:MOSC domain-containing protein YiiM